MLSHWLEGGVIEAITAGVSGSPAPRPARKVRKGAVGGEEGQEVTTQKVRLEGSRERREIKKRSRC